MLKGPSNRFDTHFSCHIFLLKCRRMYGLCRNFLLRKHMYIYIYIYTYQKKIWNLSRMSITLREFFQPCCHLVSSCRRPRTSKLPSFHADHLLTDSGWWFQPLWKIWTWTGMIVPNIWKKKSPKPPTSITDLRENLQESEERFRHRSLQPSLGIGLHDSFWVRQTSGVKRCSL